MCTWSELSTLFQPIEALIFPKPTCYIRTMTIRAREGVAAEFLRKALAAEALGVAKLNAMARAAGLLTERQRITDARVFRQAKTALGIRSVRDGFGPRGGWAWELPRDREERAPTPSAIGPQLSRKERAIPCEWVEGVAQLEQHQPPADVPRHRWRQFVDDCNGFLNSPEAERAAQLGWHTTALFGCKPSYPLSYLGEAGLLWHVNGGRIVELHRDWAVLDRPVNRSQSVFYRRDLDRAKIALPWMLQLVKTR
jgi:hypothetical protein